MNYRGKRIFVYGLGRSGFAASILLTGQGAEVIAADIIPELGLKVNLERLRKLGVKIFTGNSSLRHLDGVDLMVLSPGIPVEHPIVRIAKERNIAVIGELELAFQFCHVPIIAITGTNGKSTSCALTGAIINNTGIDCKIVGNIGVPFSSVVPLHKGMAVVEVSSYQLETVSSFKPHIGVWLNLTADHLSRHSTIEEYARMKGRLFELQSSQDFRVFNADDPMVVEYSQCGLGEIVPFSFRECRGVFMRNGQLCVEWRDISAIIVDVNEIRLKGRHNIENCLAATAAAIAYGVEPEIICETLKSFPGIEHRQEFVLRYKEVDFINDSKSTNVNSGIKAMETVKAPIILIAGGQGKGESFIQIEDLVRSKVKLLITMGETAEQLSRELSDAAETMYAKDMESAVRLAVESARAGDTILLSPMCASFDMFEDFEERGRVFKSIVKEYADGK